MKPTTLIKYLKSSNRIITLVNELYETEIVDAAVRYYEDIRGRLPYLQDSLCCRVGNKVIVVTEEKYHVDYSNLRKQMNFFMHAINGMEDNKLKDVDVYYIILDGTSVSLEPKAEMNGVTNGYAILSLANNHADVFDITYDEGHMPYALQKSKVLRDYAAWSLAGHNILQNGGIPYAMYERLSDWAKKQAYADNEFAPYAFAEHNGVIQEAFEEWELEMSIQNARNEAFLNGCPTMKRDHKTT